MPQSGRQFDDEGRSPPDRRKYRAGSTPLGESLLKADRAVLVFEAIGDDKVRVNCSSWEDTRVILADQALEVVALGKILHICRVDRPAEHLNVELNGLAEAATGLSQRNAGAVTT
jgi:hypothetical protein